MLIELIMVNKYGTRSFIFVEHMSFGFYSQFHTQLHTTQHMGIHPRLVIELDPA